MGIIAIEGIRTSPLPLARARSLASLRSLIPKKAIGAALYVGDPVLGFIEMLMIEGVSTAVLVGDAI
jgi:hypothetical protein